jgi:hypothetical protein
MSKPSCETCRFWEDCEPDEPPSPEQLVPGLMSAPTKYGFCHRYPPNPNPPEGQHGWPVTDYRDWCGEWRRKEQS